MVRYVKVIDQLGGKGLNKYQRSVLALELEDLYRKLAYDNLVKGGLFRELLNQPSHNKFKHIDIYKSLAAVAGISHQILWKVKKIQRIASKEKRQMLEQGKASINQIWAACVHIQ